MRVLGISGSLREGSHNTELLRAAAKLLPPGTQLELYEGLAGIPPYGEDVEHEPPQAVTELKDAIAAADVVLFSTPEYNHSLPGQLKNALDWVSRPYAGNPLMRQARGGARRELGHVRSRVGAGGAAEGGHRDGRTGDRPRVPPRRRQGRLLAGRHPGGRRAASRSWRTWSQSCVTTSWSPPETRRFRCADPDLNGGMKQMTVTDQLLENSKRYAESFDKGDLPLPPAKKLAVVACMDARLIPTRVLGLDEGDAHVIRNAGGMIAEDEIRSLSISQHLLGTEEIILIHHTECGMLTFTDEEFKAQLREATGQEPDWDVRGFHRPRRERAGVDSAHQGQPVHPAQGGARVRL